jgi:hypothetical protein
MIGRRMGLGIVMCTLSSFVRILIVAIISSVLVSCVAAPVDEAKSFVAAVAATKTASDALCDQLDVAERQLQIRRIERQTINNFAVQNAYYYATIGEPPKTREFRNAIQIVSSYAALLLNLLQGTNSDAQRGEIITIIQNVATLAGVTGIGPVAQELTPLLNQLLLAQSQAEARQLAMAGAPKVANLIVQLKNATPAMFELLLANAEPATPAAIKSLKTALGNYVVTLDDLQQSFMRLLDAYQRPSNPTTLAGLAELTGKLNADAVAVRQALVKAH